MEDKEFVVRMYEEFPWLEETGDLEEERKKVEQNWETQRRLLENRGSVIQELIFATLKDNPEQILEINVRGVEEKLVQLRFRHGEWCLTETKQVGEET